MTGLRAGGFLSLTGPLAPRVVVSPSRAMSMKSALRIYLSVSYVMIGILRIGSLRSPPKGECISDARRAVVWFSHGRKPGCEGFIQNWRLLSIKRRPLPPFEPSEPFEPERRRRLNPQAPMGLVHKAPTPIPLTSPPLHFFPYLWYIESDIFNSLQGREKVHGWN